MPIQINTHESRPAIDYDFLHMQECTIRLAATDGAKTSIRAVFIPYGYTDDGEKIFNPSGKIVLEEGDFLTLAMRKAGYGDMTYINSFAGMESALTQLLNEKMPKIVGTASQVL